MCVFNPKLSKVPEQFEMSKCKARSMLYIKLKIGSCVGHAILYNVQ
jgi:hypothetical protein